MSQGDSAQQQALADQHHQHLDADGLQLHGASDSQQQQHGSQDVAPPQLDMLSQQLHQVLVADTTRFWSATVGPSAQSIFQGTMVLQKEAADLSSRAGAEMQELMTELNRVHHLVASFQDQIRETLSLLQG